MLEALSDFISKVTRGEKIRIGGKEAQWKKVAEIRPGMMVAVPKSLPDDFDPLPTCPPKLEERRRELSDVKSRSQVSEGDGNSDVLWDEIVSVKRLSPERVWDIEVEGTHNFVAGHLIETPLTDTERLINEEPLRGPPVQGDLLSKDKTISAAERWFGGFFAHNTAIFGAGEGGTPTATTIRGAGAAGTNVAGANFTFDASNGTGTGGSGAWIFRTAPAGASGTSADTLAEALRITNTGLLGIGNTAPTSRTNILNNPTGTATTGKAALVVDQYENQDIFSASASGTTEFKVTRAGDAVANRFVDLAGSEFLLDPANSGVSLNVNGRIISNTKADESGTWQTLVLRGSNDNTGTTASVCIEGSSTTSTVCDGKIDAGTFDPPYTINGKHYATFSPGMTGVKEETTGTVLTAELVPGVGYRNTINFASAPADSDNWLFARTTDLANNLDKLVVLLSPSADTRTWYTLDPATLTLAVYSSLPTQVSYRLTAPRFDWATWGNVRKDKLGGFKISGSVDTQISINKFGSLITPDAHNLSQASLSRDAQGYTVKTSQGDAIAEVSAFAQSVIGTVKAGLVQAQTITANNINLPSIEAINIAGQSLSDYIRGVVANQISQIGPISPISEAIKTNVISPLSSQASESAGIAVRLGERQTFGIYNEEGTPAASFDNLGNVRLQGDLTARQATFSGTVTAESGVFNNVTMKQFNNGGNATIAGSLNVAGSATVSGTLYADHVKISRLDADEINVAGHVVTRFGEIGNLASDRVSAATVSANYITNVINQVVNSSGFVIPAQAGIHLKSNWIPDQVGDDSKIDATSSALLALISNNSNVTNTTNLLASTSGTIFVPNDLTVLGSTMLGATTVAGNLTVTGQLAIGSAGLSTEGFTLYIERSKLAPVDILAGTLVVNPAGNVMINGDLVVSGNVAIGGVLGVDTISPLSGNQLTFDLGRPVNSTQSSVIPDLVGNPALDPRLREDDKVGGFGKLLVKGLGGATVASIDASGSASFAGNVVASGSGIFNKLVIASNLTNLPNSTNSASLSGHEATPSATIGTALLPAGTVEVAVPTTQVTDKSLIYITPITSTKNEVLYLKNRITNQSFTVGLDIALPTDVSFNWWVVN